mgnify:CR=1 FL=1
MKRKSKSKTELQSWSDASTRDMMKYYWNKLKIDRRITILWAVEMILAVMIGASIAIYLDPEWNVVPFPWNVIAFGIMLGIAILIHRRTRPFRMARKIKGKKGLV